MQCRTQRIEDYEGAPQFKPVTLEYKELFENYTKGYGYIQSEASFANHYIWQHSWDIQLADQTKSLLISMDSDIYRPLILAPFLKDKNDSIEPHMIECEEYMLDTFDTFYMKSATKDMVEKIKADCGDRYAFEHDKANSEYVYNSDDLINLSGKKYHSKRNHINTFNRNYHGILEDYQPKHREQCLALQDAWAKSVGADERAAEEEYESIRRALDHLDELALEACVILIDGQVEAFSVGERVSEEAAIIHIEKANRDFDGIYAFINREFAANYWKECKYINREEDMGIPGLRRAKRSYYPAFMLDKYDVVLNSK